MSTFPYLEYDCQLKACPLCGGEAHVEGGYVCFFLNNLSVRCRSCGMTTALGQFTTPGELVDFWNKRPTQAKRGREMGHDVA